MSYSICVRPSGHTFRCEDDETILEAGLRQGFALPYGCRNGTCGSCRGRVLSGEIDYGGELPPGLSEDEARAGYALLCQAFAMDDMDIEVKEIGAAKDIRVRVLPVRVAERRRLAHDVMGLYLKLPASERLQFLAGQYIDVLLKDGRRRSFSLANAPHEDGLLELHVRHVPGGRFTDFVFNEMKDKAILRIEAPLGSFVLREDSPRPMLMVAGGTGFAPIKGLINHALSVADPRPIHLFWGVRARRDLYLDEVATRWAEDHAHVCYTPVLSAPRPEDAWSGERGYVHDAVLRHYPELAGFDVYMSGPPPMIDAAKAAFAAHGLPPDQLYYDSFEFAEDSRDAAAQVEPAVKTGA